MLAVLCGFHGLSPCPTAFLPLGSYLRSVLDPKDKVGKVTSGSHADKSLLLKNTWPMSWWDPPCCCLTAPCHMLSVRATVAGLHPWFCLALCCSRSSLSMWVCSGWLGCKEARERKRGILSRIACDLPSQISIQAFKSIIQQFRWSLAGLQGICPPLCVAWRAHVATSALSCWINPSCTRGEKNVGVLSGTAELWKLLWLSEAEVYAKPCWGRPLKKASPWNGGYNHKQNMEGSTRVVVNAAAGHGWVLSSKSLELAMHTWFHGLEGGMNWTWERGHGSCLCRQVNLKDGD